MSEEEKKNDSSPSESSQDEDRVSPGESAHSDSGRRLSQLPDNDRDGNKSSRSEANSRPPSAKSHQSENMSERGSQKDRRSSVGSAKSRNSDGMSEHSEKSKGSNSRRSSISKNSHRSSTKSNQENRERRQSGQSQNSRTSQKRLSIQSAEPDVEVLGPGKTNLERASSLPDISRKMKSLKKTLQDSPKPPVFYPHTALIQVAARTPLYNGFIGSGILQAFQPQALQEMREEQLQKLKKSLKHTTQNEKQRIEQEKTRLVPRSTNERQRSEPRILYENYINRTETFGEPKVVEGRTRKWKPKFPEKPNPDENHTNEKEEKAPIRFQRKSLRNTLVHCEQITTGQRPVDLDGRVPNCLRFPVNYGQQPRLRSCQHSPWGSVSLLNKHCIVSTYLPHPKGESAGATRPLSAPSKLQSLHNEESQDDEEALPTTLAVNDAVETDAEEEATNNNGEYYFKYNGSNARRVSFAAEDAEESDTPRTARSDRPKSAKRRTSTIVDDDEDDVNENSDGSSLEDETVKHKTKKSPNHILEEEEAEDEEIEERGSDNLEDQNSVAGSVHSFKSAASVIVESDDDESVRSFKSDDGSRKSFKTSAYHKRKSHAAHSKSQSSEEEEATTAERKSHKSKRVKRSKSIVSNSRQSVTSAENRSIKSTKSFQSSSSRGKSPQAHFTYNEDKPVPVANDFDGGNSGYSSINSDAEKQSKNGSTSTENSDSDNAVDTEEWKRSYGTSYHDERDLNATYEKKSDKDLNSVNNKKLSSGHQSDHLSIEADKSISSNNSSDKEEDQNDTSDSASGDDKDQQNNVTSQTPRSQTPTSQRKVEDGALSSRRSSKASQPAGGLGSKASSIKNIDDKLENQDDSRSNGSHSSSKASKLSQRSGLNEVGSRRNSNASVSSKISHEVNSGRNSKLSGASVASHTDVNSNQGNYMPHRKMSNVSNQSNSNNNIDMALDRSIKGGSYNDQERGKSSVFSDHSSRVDNQSERRTSRQSSRSSLKSKTSENVHVQSRSNLSSSLLNCNIGGEVENEREIAHGSLNARSDILLDSHGTNETESPLISSRASNRRYSKSSIVSKKSGNDSDQAYGERGRRKSGKSGTPERKEMNDSKSSLHENDVHENQRQSSAMDEQAPAMGDDQSSASGMSYTAGGHDDIPDVIRPSDSRRSSRASKSTRSTKSISSK